MERTISSKLLVVIDRINLERDAISLEGLSITNYSSFNSPNVISGMSFVFLSLEEEQTVELLTWQSN